MASTLMAQLCAVLPHPALPETLQRHTGRSLIQNFIFLLAGLKHNHKIEAVESVINAEIPVIHLSGTVWRLAGRCQ